MKKKFFLRSFQGLLWVSFCLERFRHFNSSFFQLKFIKRALLSLPLPPPLLIARQANLYKSKLIKMIQKYSLKISHILQNCSVEEKEVEFFFSIQVS